MRSVRVLADASNGVVVHCEGRRHPGLVVQGDRLEYWLGLAKDGDENSLALLVDALQDSVDYFRSIVSGPDS